MNATIDQPRLSMTGAQWAMLLLLGLIWGASFFFARIAVAEIPPLSLVFLRVFLAALALNAWLVFRGTPLAQLVTLSLPFAALSVLNNIIPFSLIFTGQTEIGAGLASVLNATTPFWTIMLAAVLTTNEPLSRLKLAGVLLGIAGTAVMVGPDLAAGLGAPWWAKLAVVGAAVSYAFAAIFAKRFSSLEPFMIAASQLTWSAILIAPAVALIDGPAMFAVSDPVIWLCVAAIAVPCTAFAYILYFSLIAGAGATNAALVTLIVPVSALVLGATILGETLAAFEIAGMTLVGIGLVVIDGRLFVRR